MLRRGNAPKRTHGGNGRKNQAHALRRRGRLRRGRVYKAGAFHPAWMGRRCWSRRGCKGAMAGLPCRRAAGLCRSGGRYRMAGGVCWRAPGQDAERRHQPQGQIKFFLPRELHRSYYALLWRTSGRNIQLFNGNAPGLVPDSQVSSACEAFWQPTRERVAIMRAYQRRQFIRIAERTASAIPSRER